MTSPSIKGVYYFLFLRVFFNFIRILRVFLGLRDLFLFPPYCGSLAPDSADGLASGGWSAPELFVFRGLDIETLRAFGRLP